MSFYSELEKITRLCKSEILTSIFLLLILKIFEQCLSRKNN